MQGSIEAVKTFGDRAKPPHVLEIRFEKHPKSAAPLLLEALPQGGFLAPMLPAAERQALHRLCRCPHFVLPSVVGILTRAFPARFARYA